MGLKKLAALPVPLVEPGVVEPAKVVTTLEEVTCLISWLL